MYITLDRSRLLRPGALHTKIPLHVPIESHRHSRRSAGWTDSSLSKTRREERIDQVESLSHAQMHTQTNLSEAEELEPHVRRGKASKR